MNRREFAKSVAAISAASSFVSTNDLLASTSSPDKNAFKIIAGPYLQAPTDTSVTIMWITNADSTATVEYGTAETLDKKAASTTDGQIDANTTIHRVKVTGLKPGSKYSYRITSTEIEKYEPYKVTYGQAVKSSTYSFQTLAPNKTDCSFIVLNDIHSNIKTLQGELAIANQKPYEMIFLNGDIINDPMSEKQIISQTLKPATELFANEIPFLLTRGNHETRGAYARLLKSYIATPNDKYYYSFKHGPIYFIVLDSGEDKEDSHWAYSGLNNFDSYRDEQTEWLKKKIQKEEFKKAPFRVVLSHIPLFGSGDAHGTLDCRKKWAALLNEGEINLHISGHTHRPAVLEPVADEHNYPIFIGGGPHEENFTVIRVDATTEKLNIAMTGSDGKLIKETEINPR